MARAFDVATKAPRFELPPITRQQIQALILDLNLDAREVIIRAVAELWQHEMGEPDRDVWLEIEELKQQVAALMPQKERP